MAWTVVALLVAVAALASNVVIPGPQGPAGPSGPPGRTGNGTIMAQDQAFTTGIDAIARTCTHFPGAEVTIAVPGPGTVVVTSEVDVFLDHLTGTVDRVIVFQGANDTDCTADGWSSNVDIEADRASSNNYYRALIVHESIDIAAAGAYTFYVNGRMELGESTFDRWQQAATIAVFYPS